MNKIKLPKMPEAMRKHGLQWFGASQMEDHARRAVMADRRRMVPQIRQAMADYMRAEGCGCCSDAEGQRKAAARLADRLNVPAYSDGSGFEFHNFCTGVKR